MTTGKPAIPTTLLRLYHLRDVVFPLAELRETQNRLNLDIYWDKHGACGTTGCLLGWATQTEQLQQDGWVLTSMGFPRLLGREDGITSDSAIDYYGLRPGEFGAIFGTTKSGGTLADRKEALSHIIAEREEALSWQSE